MSVLPSNTIEGATHTVQVSLTKKRGEEGRQNHLELRYKKDTELSFEEEQLLNTHQISVVSEIPLIM